MQAGSFHLHQKLCIPFPFRKIKPKQTSKYQKETIGINYKFYTSGKLENKVKFILFKGCVHLFAHKTKPQKIIYFCGAYRGFLKLKTYRLWQLSKQ